MSDVYAGSLPGKVDDAPSKTTRAEVRSSLKRFNTEVNDTLFAGKVILCGALIALGVALTLDLGPWGKVAGAILLGCMFAHAAELQHQTLHNLGFRNRRANALIGIVLGVPMLISFTAYRVAHLRHHRDLGTPMNKEFFAYGDQYGGSSQARSRLGTVWLWFTRFALLLHWREFALNMARTLRGSDFDGESQGISRRMRRDYRIILATLLAVTGLSAALGEALIVWLWLVPLLLVAAPVHAAIELPEHFRCKILDRDPFANTRTIRSNWFMIWFTNGNNFHVEHHLMPNLPIERLPEFHQEVRGRLRYYNATYLDFFSSLRPERKRIASERDLG